jgi:hypothetical protein
LDGDFLNSALNVRREMFSWTVVFSVVLILGIVVGLYFSPNPETLIMVVALASLVVYGYNRHWRNPAD